jgi:hypothetical protein
MEKGTDFAAALDQASNEKSLLLLRVYSSNKSGWW